MKYLKSVLLFLSGSVLLCAASAAGDPPTNEVLQSAVNDLYQSNFAASRQTLIAYSTAHPQDPLPYSMKAASYLFAELERAGALRGDLLSDDHHVQHGGSFKPDGKTEAALDESVVQTRKYARLRLLENPNDRNALLAMCIVTGVQRDYLALVEHKLRESYTYIRESSAYAKRLLAADPSAYDAYLTKGFTEYLVANLPFYLRWIIYSIDCAHQRS